MNNVGKITFATVCEQIRTQHPEYAKLSDDAIKGLLSYKPDLVNIPFEQLQQLLAGETLAPEDSVSITTQKEGADTPKNPAVKKSIRRNC